jgi:hypothetical protein
MLGFLRTDRRRIEAIAEHEQVPEIVAAELAESLLRSTEGIRLIERYIREDIEHAEAHGHPAKAERLHRVLDHFNATHPT